MNEERAHLLINYLGELTKLRSEGFACTDEINRCLAMIESEFANIEPVEQKEVGFICEARTKDGVFTSYGLSEVTTKQLTNELSRRSGVKEYVIGPHGDIERIHIDKVSNGYAETIEGPASILVIID